MAIREAVPQVVRGDVQQPAVPRQVRPSRSTKDRVPAAGKPPAAATTTKAVRVLPQIAVVAAAVAVYFLVRGATNSDPSVAVENAHRIIGWERWLGIYHEPALQRDLASSEALRTVLNWVYIWGHWPVIVTTFLILARYNAAVYLRLRNAMMLSGAIGFAFFALFPVAPPRLAGLGMADTVTLTSHSYRVLQPTIFTNQFAAMPSLHAGWNLLIGLAIVAAARRPLLKALGVVLPMAMIATVVLTANHYLLDVVVGVSLTTTCWVLVALPWRRMVVRLKPTGTRGRSSGPMRHRVVEGHSAGN
ncbi:phosphatase PAP2 family protein [Virgisporangium aurantiacum]|uniref:phosphatase PAP2 family protein n=1 Tax=Virgisporangium aurantiacum TaxID=175570 RepID=UPI00194E69C3|nr:phosphatase PAP2 family protein [Virgisporangium aurantiacum]